MRLTSLCISKLMSTSTFGLSDYHFFLIYLKVNLIKIQQQYIIIINPYVLYLYKTHKTYNTPTTILSCSMCSSICQKTGGLNSFGDKWNTNAYNHFVILLPFTNKNWWWSYDLSKCISIMNMYNNKNVHLFRNILHNKIDENSFYVHIKA